MADPMLRCEKQEDLICGYGELCRVYDPDADSHALLRQWSVSGDEDAQKIVASLMLNHRLVHSNLIKIKSFNYFYTEAKLPPTQDKELMKLYQFIGEWKESDRKESGWTIRVMLQDVECTLDDFLRRRLAQQEPLSKSFMQSFLKSFVDMLAELQAKKLEVRDICPWNIFLPKPSQEASGARLLLGDSSEYLKFYLQPFAKKITFSKCFENYLAYMAPELKESFISATFSCHHRCKYTASVYSLGLVALYMCTLQCQGGLNLADGKIQQTIKQRLKDVKTAYGYELKRVLKLMLQFDCARRPDFLRLDNLCPEFERYLKMDYTADNEALTITNKENYILQLSAMSRHLRALSIHSVDLSSLNLDAVIHQEKAYQLQELALTRCQIGEAQINFLLDAKKFPMMRRFSLDAPRSHSDYCIQRLVQAGLTELKYLHLVDCHLSTAAVNTLASAQGEKLLERLSEFSLCGNTDIGDSGVESLLAHTTSLCKLKRIYLRGCGLSIKSVYLLGESMKLLPKLRLVDMSDNILENDTLLYIIESR